MPLKTKLYKLTDNNGRTLNNTQWGENVTHEASGRSAYLCSDGWIHAYEHPLLAVLLNPIHANFEHPLLWEAEGEIGIRDAQLKIGCKKLTTIKRMGLPVITTEMRVKFSIYCALAVYKEPRFVNWADCWLSSSDRSQRVAAMVARAADRAAGKAAWAASESEERAAWAAARAAEEAARIAGEAAWAAAGAARIAGEAAWAAWVAARIAEQAVRVADINLAMLAEKACS